MGEPFKRQRVQRSLSGIPLRSEHFNNDASRNMFRSSTTADMPDVSKIRRALVSLRTRQCADGLRTGAAVSLEAANESDCGVGERVPTPRRGEQPSEHVHAQTYCAERFPLDRDCDEPDAWLLKLTFQQSQQRTRSGEIEQAGVGQGHDHTRDSFDSGRDRCDEGDDEDYRLVAADGDNRDEEDGDENQGILGKRAAPEPNDINPSVPDVTADESDSDQDNDESDIDEPDQVPCSKVLRKRMDKYVTWDRMVANVSFCGKRAFTAEQYLFL